MVEELKKVMLRDLTQLEKEISLYTNDADLWLLQDGISNTAGNLSLHIAGNLQHFIGHVLGGSEYVRDREAEFGDKNVSVDIILKEVTAAKKAVSEVLPSLTSKQLEEDFPIILGGQTFTTKLFLIHLSGHLMYHLGQINYHRRLLTN